MAGYRFIDRNGSFELENAENYSGLYFPIAGESGIKSALTPVLSGDVKLDQNHFIMEPVSVENLHNNRSGRNFWCHIKSCGNWSASGTSAEQQAQKFTDMQEHTTLQAGMMWHTICRTSKKYQLKSTITSFVPIKENTEIMQVRIQNTGSRERIITPVAAVPIYGRSADNIRDHRHVTSLLHRIRTGKRGVYVSPSLSFDERGHQINDTTYFVAGMTQEGKNPAAFYPTVAEFIGEGGSFDRPEAVIRGKAGAAAGTECDGQEAMGGLRFEEVTLLPGEAKEYTVFIGAFTKEEELEYLFQRYQSRQDVYDALELTRQYWRHKVNVQYHTSDKNFDSFMQWVSFQPELRRIYGCSFLPHHDYGKGGRGWRDLWQDCLALLMMNPQGVRQMLISNFAGVRMDGSNATIIGEHLGEFQADRNAITRVWMDHGVWPFMTTKLYLNQTGDSELLYQKAAYFKDAQVMRGTAVDEQYEEDMTRQKDEKGNVYEGSILEHLLLQSLTSFWEVGEHNHIRLRDADWNDALDMAGARGESVAFTNAYAQNLLDLADLIEHERSEGRQQIELLREIELLLTDDTGLYEDITGKQALLEKYMQQCTHVVSGCRIEMNADVIAASLRHKGEWIQEHIRKTEWVGDEAGNGWFNGYYDNHGRQAEGRRGEDVRMMLTGQVFAVMSGTATEEQVQVIVKSADRYLYDESCGGYRLNTDFQELKTDMGRMFGFAYGEKENGAVFSHMAVMYANALYSRGFAKEGCKALKSLYRQSMDFEKSKIYPGIPEYFGQGGRGLYHYLTGAASWYMLTVITQMFGIRGQNGNLIVQPKLLKEQFDEKQRAVMELQFAEKTWEVELCNPKELEYGEYRISGAFLNGEEIAVEQDYAVVALSHIRKLDERKLHKIKLVLA